SLAVHKTRDRHPQNNPSVSPMKSTMATVSFGTPSMKLWLDRGREVRAVLEAAQRITGGRWRRGVALGIGALGDPLEDGRRVEMRGARAEVEIAEGHEPVAVVPALVVDRGGREPALEPLRPAALLQDASRVREVVAEKTVCLALVNDAADDGAPRGNGTHVHVADLVKDGEDVVAGAKSEP